MEPAKIMDFPNQKRPETLLTVKQASQEFGIGRDRLYQLAHTVPKTGFPALWFGPKTVKFPREALREWLSSERGRQALFQTMKGK
ncbi:MULTISPECIES: helix-turn-helix domain-containing protein [unclassified Dehalobacter]|uniref:helix-turn-helix transcriptional regulator n=1 Tax=unclassified Dehalobacter TaxID=2635733 RepID=UPI00059E724C|nr:MULTISPECIES: helix-turn-helix domain-containing protein [unclassified Dehalobacter]